MQLKRIGYWEGPDAPGWPRVEDFVDRSWSDEERVVVANYLETGTIAAVWCGLSECRLCRKANGALEYTDGTYVWPEGLVHYVREHGVRLPEEVLGHIRERAEAIEHAEVNAEGWKQAEPDWR